MAEQKSAQRRKEKRHLPSSSSPYLGESEESRLRSELAPGWCLSSSQPLRKRPADLKATATSGCTSIVRKRIPAGARSVSIGQAHPQAISRILRNSGTKLCSAEPGL